MKHIGMNGDSLATIIGRAHSYLMDYNTYSATRIRLITHRVRFIIYGEGVFNLGFYQQSLASFECTQLG